MQKVKGMRIIACGATIVLSCCVATAQESSKLWGLQDCLDYAMENNISIQKNRIASESSQVDLLTAKAALFPSLSFSTGHNYVNRPLIDDGSDRKNSYNANYGLNASWTVYNGGKNVKTINQQKLTNRMAELDVNLMEDNIQVSIMQLYLQILYASESIKINESNLEVSDAQLNRAKELLNVGYIAKSDYAQLEAQYSNDKYALVNSQSSLQSYKLQLKQLLELDGEEEMNLLLPELNDDNVIQPLPAKMDVYKTALTFRPEIEAGKIDVESSEIAIDIAKSGYYPSISLTAGTGTTHTSGTDFTFGEQVKNGWNNTVGVTLSVPIFKNRQNKSAVQKAKLNLQSSKLNLLSEEKALFSTIEGYWLDATTAQQQYMAAKEKLRSSEISYELVNEQFTLGMKNTVELLTEKNNLLSAQEQLIQAKYMAILNIKLLNFYQGEEFKL
ncbi:TolC family protein [Bacteroides sp. 214]|uniref:TolC family protein n=1 Tax=Bacteroides sp. 214 TaxID=2302935 RepID=UPI0013D12C3E|nr:TolC family protein [Bacteroides sp. 214]NDW12971.1 TolC family protein [Bacteroides sp. 214]